MSSLSSIQSTVGIQSYQSTKSASPYVQTESSSSRPINEEQETVTISNQAKVASLGHDLPYDEVAFELFERWKSSDQLFMVDKEKPLEELLPENQELIGQLKDKMHQAKSKDDSDFYESRISFVQRYGDKESFSSEYEMEQFREKVKLGTDYLFRDILNNPQNYPFVGVNPPDLIAKLRNNSW